MNLIVCPNGNRTLIGTHISVFANILYGPYDNQLKWALKDVFTIELLNQLEDSNHHSVTISFRSTDGKPGSGSGFSAFF